MVGIQQWKRWLSVYFDTPLPPSVENSLDKEQYECPCAPTIYRGSDLGVISTRWPVTITCAVTCTSLSSRDCPTNKFYELWRVNEEDLMSSSVFKLYSSSWLAASLGKKRGVAKHTAGRYGSLFGKLYVSTSIYALLWLHGHTCLSSVYVYTEESTQGPRAVRRV